MGPEDKCLETSAVAKEGQVVRELSALQSNVGDLLAVIEKLGVKLQPILFQAPTKSGDGSTLDKNPQCDVAATISDQSQRIYEARMALKRMISDIQL